VEIHHEEITQEMKMGVSVFDSLINNSWGYQPRTRELEGPRNSTVESLLWEML